MLPKLAWRAEIEERYHLILSHRDRSIISARESEVVEAEAVQRIFIRVSSLFTGVVSWGGCRLTEA
jgi:hypothetical protein